jgi:hypothetical protein
MRAKYGVRMNAASEKKTRERLGVVLYDGERRPKNNWDTEDSERIRKLRSENISMRGISAIMRCSTRTVQEVLRGER